MTKDFSRLYDIQRKTKVQISFEDIVNNTTKKLWESCGIMNVYYTAIVQYLFELSKMLGDKHYLTKDDLLMIINSFCKDENVPKEVKDLCKTILKESNYNKKEPKFLVGDMFYINHKEPAIDDSRIICIVGNFYVTKIDDYSYEDNIYYQLSRKDSTDVILVKEEILEKSEKGWR